MNAPNFDPIAAIDAWLDESITTADHAALDAWLAQDGARVRMLAARARLHRNLLAAMGDARANAPRHVEPAIEAGPARRRLFIAGLAVAATLLVGTVVVTLAIVGLGSADPSPRDATPAGPLASVTDVSEDGTLLIDDQMASAGNEYVGRSVKLDTGEAEFMLRSGATVRLRGASELRMTSGLSATLIRGFVEIECSGSAHGYTLHLPAGARVVDLGTRFEVELEDSGRALVRVTEGSVSVVGTNAPGETFATDDRAVVIDGFVYRLRERSLAATMLGEAAAGRRAIGLDLSRGTVRDAVDRGEVLGDGSYHPVEASTVIDGVFIPASTGPVIVSTAGHVIEGLPTHTGKSWGGPMVRETGEVYLHANSGVTFDLAAMRGEGKAGTGPARFVATLEHAAAAGWKGAMDVTVAIDGEVRWRGRVERGRQRLPIALWIEPTERFLTWIVTDGGDGMGNDGVLFVEPQIELAATSAPVESRADEIGR